MTNSRVFIFVQKEDFSLQDEFEQIKAMQAQAQLEGAPHADTKGQIKGQDKPMPIGSECGAVVSFTGLVRGQGIRSLELEHYPAMTERCLTDIAATAQARFGLLAIRIVHRVGLLLPGENIVCVVAAAPHRQAAFDGANFAMDYLKTQAPFWKKETRLDGSAHWVSARDCDEQAQQRWQTGAAA